MRPGRAARDRRACGISIHAPLTGCDTDLSHSLILIDISIHAPLTGCDNPSLSQRIIERYNFNPRTPDGVRRITAITSAMSFLISIHAPLTGCDSILPNPLVVGKISIHAPLTGCDSVKALSMLNPEYFNPRTPDGVRLSYQF